jgi:response regulator of citrate/malate metabolism
MEQLQNVLHYPRLDTVLMVEEAIKKAKEYPTRTQLWRSLPKGVQYQTLQLILSYLQESNKIFITKEGKIMWVLAENSAARKLLKESVKYARG